MTLNNYRPRCPQRDFIHPRPVQSLPSLREFLRTEGIATDIEPRQEGLISATREVAREEAMRRALRAAATRYVFLECNRSVVSLSTLSSHTRIGPLHGYEPRNGTSLAEYPAFQPLNEVCRPASNRRWALYSWFSALVDGTHRNRDCRESSPYQKVARRSMPSLPTASGDDCRVRKSPSCLRPRVGTVEERMSREVETFTCVFPEFKVGGGVDFLFRSPPPLPAPFTLRDEAVSPPPSRKRPRPTYLELVPSVIASLCY